MYSVIKLRRAEKSFAGQEGKYQFIEKYSSIFFESPFSPRSGLD